MTVVSKSVADVLGKPIFAYLDDEAKKIRRNLIFISFVCLSISLMGIGISSESSLLGVKFSNLKDSHIRIALAIFNIYFLVHFMWVAYESYAEWSVRVTGTKVAFTTGAKSGDINADYPDDPRNSSLYNWWLTVSNNFPDEHAECSSVSKDILKSITRIQELRIEYVNDPGKFTLSPDKEAAQGFQSEIYNKLSRIRQQLETLNNNNDVILRFIQSDRVIESLKRFDERFKSLVKSQNRRWMLLDVAFPIVLSIASIAALYFYQPASLSECFCSA